MGGVDYLTHDGLVFDVVGNVVGDPRQAVVFGDQADGGADVGPGSHHPSRGGLVVFREGLDHLKLVKGVVGVGLVDLDVTREVGGVTEGVSVPHTHLQATS